MVFDAYGDSKNPTLVLLHGAAALDTFAHQYDTLTQRILRSRAASARRGRGRGRGI
jgi:hypothetical protein